MLVLSRRTGEEIVFPTLGIKVRMVKAEGNTARLGIEAPRHVPVFRAELLQGEEAAALSDESRAAAHELCNRLSKVTLSLHLFERLWQAGRSGDAQAAFARVMDALSGLDRDCVLRSVGSPTSGLVPCRALIVDDDRNERELLAGLLNMNGCECRTAGDGAEALRSLGEGEATDFVLLDNWMPNMDGPRTLAAIRGDGRFDGVKVFSISPTPPEEAGVGVGPRGYDAWFPKPLDPGRLWRAMRQQLGVEA